ncbi:ATP-binding protein [Streptomyces sp. NPDC059999]|uniref:ATP-binding protein n=1 Tax=Streptomyces sp. NPDC059999 TaxID=3347030 RepID=UPI0036BFA292
MTSPRVPSMVLADAPLAWACAETLPASYAQTDGVPQPARFREGAEAVVWCGRPAGPGSYRPEDALYVKDIRRFTVSHMCRWGIGAEVTSAAELMASELVTNELRHGCSSSIRVRLMVADGGFLLTVTGGGPYVPTFAMAGPDEVSKRGLFLVDQLARDLRGCWGVASDGTTWCLMPSSALRDAA